MYSGSEAGSYLRLIDCVYHSALGFRVIKKKMWESKGTCSMSVPRNMRCGRTQSCTENEPANSNHGASPREVFRGVTYTNLAGGLGVKGYGV